jgi:hypothetical protein
VILRDLTQFHENPVVIAWWRVRLGRVLTGFTPFRRRALLAAAAAVIGVTQPLRLLRKANELSVPVDALGKACVVLVTFGILWLVYRAALSFSVLPAEVRRRPQLILHLTYWGCLVVLWNTAPSAGPWRGILLGITVIFPYLIWRCGYLLLTGQQGRMTGSRFTDHLLYLWPVYGGSSTPYGKGHGYLSRCEAKTDEELARSQLAGIKLILLSVLWRALANLMKGSFYGPGNAATGTPTATLGLHTAGIPQLAELVNATTVVPLWIAWASVYCELFWQVLHHAARGHSIIGILRLFGFNVFRNTYKPLLAQSVVEFWNRYYYYFKELLATFFFLPTFTRLGAGLRRWPALRLFLAVFAAAFVGNMYYHLLQRTPLLVEGDVFEAVYGLRSRVFYCLLLALGIFVSMQREQRRSSQTRVAGRPGVVLRILGVWTFFGLITIWNVQGDAPFFARVDFFLGLFGLA